MKVLDVDACVVLVSSAEGSVGAKGSWHAAPQSRLAEAKLLGPSHSIFMRQLHGQLRTFSSNTPGYCPHNSLFWLKTTSRCPTVSSPPFQPRHAPRCRTQGRLATARQSVVAQLKDPAGHASKGASNAISRSPSAAVASALRRTTAATTRSCFDGRSGPPRQCLNASYSWLCNVLWMD